MQRAHCQAFLDGGLSTLRQPRARCFNEIMNEIMLGNPLPDTAELSATALKQCRYGRMLYLRRDQYIGRSLDLYGEFSEGECQLFAQLLQPGQIVAEIGANIGAHTVYLAKRVGPSGTVLAFEPQRAMFYLLCANLALNEQFQVHAYRTALGAAPGSIKVPAVDHRAAGNFGGVSLHHGETGEDVPLVTLDGFALPSLRLLKVDVEGMETEVLLGARQTIARCRPILYVENDRQEKSAQLIRTIEDLGYDLYWHLPPLFSPDNFAGCRDNVFPGIVSENMLGIPKEMGMPVSGSRRVAGPEDRWQRSR
jgi:FkbM family methyltransferase